jgi:PilZ domain
MEDFGDRRQFWRATFRSPVQLANKSGSVDAELIDISLKGALLKAPLGWSGQVDDSCQVKLKLAKGESIVMQGRVAHVRGRRVGLRCERIDLDSITHLRRLVELNAGDAALLEREVAALIGAD